jgi:4-amino-4-deoxy-L-arabinose transferase-like glycosyltransferase
LGVGVIVTLLVALGACGLGRASFGRWTGKLDPAAKLGIEGLLGLGLLGWITLPIGLLSSGFRWGVGVIAILALFGLVQFVRERPRGAAPKGPAAIGLLVLVLAALIALVSVLAPSDMADWDSLAYHLAVPKIWLAAGQIQFVSYIHHSNFPFLVDNLYVWGELWGGESGAKAFMLAYAIYGSFAVFGLARSRYGATAGWWSTVAFATVPVVMWEAGTAYVDVAHALFGGLGVWLAAGLIDDAEPRTGNWVLPALLLGGAVGSKYTALQTVPILGAVLLAYCLLKKAGRPADVVKMGLVALAIGSSWYVKNVAWTHNPVYPFFYSKFGGVNWDAFQERIYKDQQQTFGAGRPMAANYTEGPLEPLRLGSSILGTAYMPGRYVDPAPTQGQGFPFVSLGAIPIAAMLAWLLSGRSGRREGVCLAVALLSFLAWFVLSQQARYSLVWCVPLLLMAGGAVARLRSGTVMAGAIAVQALGTLFVATRYGDAFASKLRVVLGQETPEAYQTRMLGFYEPAQFLNKLPGVKRVGLFDEVFGYLLDVPYFWAGPGHTTELGYEHLRNGGELADALKAHGISHAYVSLALGTTFGGNRDEREKFLAASGLNGAPIPYSDREARMADPRSAVKVLLAEAIATGRLKPIQSFRSGIVLEVE